LVLDSIHSEFKSLGFEPKRPKVLARPGPGSFQVQALLDTSGGHGEVLVIAAIGLYSEEIRGLANKIWPGWWRRWLSAFRMPIAYLAPKKGLDGTGWIFDCNAPRGFSEIAGSLVQMYDEVCPTWLRECSSNRDFIEIAQDYRFGLAAYSRPIAMALKGRWEEGLDWVKSIPDYSTDLQLREFIYRAKRYFANSKP